MTNDPSSFLPQLPPRPGQWPAAKSVYITLAVWLQVLGAVLVLAPDYWYGPSWSYFSQLPHNGTGMGVCCLGIGCGQLVAISNDRIRYTAVLLFLGGFVFWTAGIILGAEGLLGHRGLMEAPFMLAIGAHKFVHSAALSTAYRKTKRRK